MMNRAAARKMPHFMPALAGMLFLAFGINSFVSNETRNAECEKHPPQAPLKCGIFAAARFIIPPLLPAPQRPFLDPPQTPPSTRSRTPACTLKLADKFPPAEHTDEPSCARRPVRSSSSPGNLHAPSCGVCRKMPHFMPAAAGMLFLAFGINSFVSNETLNAEGSGQSFSVIEEGLLVGGRVPGRPAAAQVVLNVSEGPDSYAGPGDRWQPILDQSPAPRLDWLRENVAFVETARGRGETVFIHCDAGISRSGLVAAAYLMKEHRWSRDEALAHARAGRPEIRPNSAFMDLLARWQQAM